MVFSNSKLNCLNLTTTLSNWCTPLFHNSPLNSVSVERFYKNGTLKFCSTHNKALELYINNEIYNALYKGWNINDYYDGYFIDSSLIRSPEAIEYNKLLSKDYDLTNIFFICRRGKDFMDFYIFSTSKKYSFDFYINNLNFLEKFIFLLRNRLDENNIENYMFSQKIMLNKSLYSPFLELPILEEIEIIQQWNHCSNKEKIIPLHKLTLREKECLKLLSNGYTAKKIALFLGISSRTVESHNESIKAKLGIKSKKEISNLFLGPIS